MEFYVKRLVRYYLLLGLLILLVGNIALSIWADPMHWLDEIEQHYISGNWQAIEAILRENTPVNDIERAGMNYYQAKISIDKVDCLSYLEDTVSISNSSIYGQRALVELANISLLERDYQSSLNYLLRVDPRSISDRDYLLSSVYLKLEQYTDAIRSAQDFIKITKDSLKRELAYLKIVEAYILNEQYRQALLTLETMKRQNYVVNHPSIVDFKEGYSLEMMEEFDDAINKYKYIITQYPYSEYAFRAERRLYDLTLNNSQKIDYSLLSTIDTISSDQDRIPPSDVPDITSGQGENYYVQVNAFAEENNANSHSRYLRGLGFDNIVFSKIVFEQELYVVAVGPFPTQENARTSQRALKENLNLDSFIIRY